MTRLVLEGLRRTYGATVAVDRVDLEVAQGELVALLGPSGCGKTTTLRMVAGFVAPTAGRVLIGGVDVTAAPPYGRDTGMVFQGYALFPHMTVAENVGFGLEMRRVARAEREARIAEALRLVRLDGYAERRISQLSGGQQQRVALARALVVNPGVFLLDEPLSNLDAKLRVETRVELRRLQRALDVTAVYVTHDQEEAMSMSDRMAIFMDGRIVQIGTPEEVYLRPATVEVAAFLGNPPMNVLPARLASGHAVIGEARITVPHLAALGEREVMLGVRPSEITLSDQGVPATVTLCELLGEDVIVDLDVGGLLLRVKAPGRSRIAEGERVCARFDPHKLHVFDRASGERLEAPVS